MRRNNKGFEDDLAVGEEPVNTTFFEASGASAQSDSSLVISKEPPNASGGVVIDDVRVRESGKTVGDMTLLADMVMERQADRRDFNGRDWQDLLAADLSDAEAHTFPQVPIIMFGEETVRVVDSIESAIECLTTVWPIRNGDVFEYVLQTCIEGITGRVSSQQVRLVFIHAAEEAGIFVLA